MYDSCISHDCWVALDRESSCRMSKKEFVWFSRIFFFLHLVDLVIWPAGWNIIPWAKHEYSITVWGLSPKDINAARDDGYTVLSKLKQLLVCVFLESLETTNNYSSYFVYVFW